MRQQSLVAMSDSTVPTLQAMLVHLSEVGSDWFVFSLVLGVPISKLRDIETMHSKEGAMRCIVDAVQYWLDTTPDASWRYVAAALEQVGLLRLASTIKLKYLWDHTLTESAVVKSEGVSTSSSSSSATTAITASELTRSSPPSPSPASQPTELSSDATAEIETDRKIVEELRDLVSDYSLMLTKFRRLLAECDISEARFFLDTLFEPDHDIFTSCENIEQLLKQLCHRYVDTFNVYYLQKLATCLERDDAKKLVKQYEKKKDNFLKETTVLNFHKAIISKAPVVPKGMAKITIRIPKELATNKILKDMEELAIKAFGDNQKRFVQFHVIAGSVVICWFVAESLCEVLQYLAQAKVAVWRQHGVEEVMVGSQCVYHYFEASQKTDRQYFQGIKRKRSGDYETAHAAKTIKVVRTRRQSDIFASLSHVHESESEWEEDSFSSLCPVHETESDWEDQHRSVINGLNTKLEKTEEANKQLISQQTELQKRIEHLEGLLLLHVPSSFIELTGDESEIATVGHETTIKLISTSQTTSLPFSIDELSCQLTDPLHQHVPCTITSTQPGVCTVTYTPIQRGPHHLKITIRDIDIPGSPFTVKVRPSLVTRGVVQHTITSLKNPWGVAVSKNGDVIVSENFGHCISMYNKEGKKLGSFGFLDFPCGVSITSDNHIHFADSGKSRIQMYTLDSSFVKFVGGKGTGRLQFNEPSGIAVHSSGKVFVADSNNHRIQVLNPDLSYSHMFGSEGSGPGQFNHPDGVAIDSAGIVYVTDRDNHRVQLLSDRGEFISSFGSKGTHQGKLFRPSGICIDSVTNTVYVTDYNDCVSMYTSKGQFIKCFGSFGKGDGKLSNPKGVAVDSTTGTLYVCDCNNDRVVVY